MNTEIDKIKALGKLEGFRQEIRTIDTMLDELPLWQPASGLKKECREVLQRMSRMKTRIDRKLVVTIIGPGGAGKSTLMNVIAGKDDLSETGTTRPTTQKPALLCQDALDTKHLKSILGEGNVELNIDQNNRFLETFILIDTPDTDSNAQKAHIPLVRKAIKASDVLLCVFNAQNPKTRDHVDFFSKYISYFHGGSLIGILNKCDRIDEKELTQAIFPEFQTYIQDAWDRPLSSLFCISARRHLKRPQWDDNSGPRHDFDQFDGLMTMVRQSYNSPEDGLDHRLANARHLRDFMHTEVQKTIAEHVEHLEKARKHVDHSEHSGLHKALSTIREEGSGQGLGVNVLLYQRLANRWVGPVGWMIAIWARILIFGTGLMAVFRFGNPFKQVLGVLSSMRHFKNTQAHIADTEKNERVGSALRGYRTELMKAWPNIAELLVKGGFKSEVRRLEHVLPPEQQFNDTVTEIWQDALNRTLDRSARAFSNFLLQIIFNAPIIVMMVHIGWLTARHYFSGNYLSSDFFIHAFLTAGIVLLLSFFLFQACLRLFSSPDGIVGRAFKQVQEQIEPFQKNSQNPLFEQLDTILYSGSRMLES